MNKKNKVKDKYGQWEYTKIDKKFLNWINRWGNMHNKDFPLKSVDYRKGYCQCIRDLYDKLDINYKRYDGRTKDGFSKK